jgi:hypothetical protein
LAKLKTRGKNPQSADLDIFSLPENESAANLPSKNLDQALAFLLTLVVRHCSSPWQFGVSEKTGSADRPEHASDA